MQATLRQISSLEKVRSTDEINFKEIDSKTVMQGERLSYQIILKGDCGIITKVKASSPFGDGLKLFRVKEVYVDLPCYEDVKDENYITKEPGFMPDVLIPLEHQNNEINFNRRNSSLWVRVDIPKDMTPGKYTVSIEFSMMPSYCHDGCKPEAVVTKEMEINVIPAVMPEQKLIYTRWFYADCIATAHDVEVYSEKHWELIESYIAAAADVGMNMILVPIHTPPLDTEIGRARVCVQLVDIEKKGDIYEFNFDKLERFINICKKHGIKYYEMAHMFSQWGSKCAPNIQVTENGKKDYMFGWHVAADSKEYVAFLEQYVKAVSAELDREGVLTQTYFHVSDEPDLSNMDRYATARSIIKPLIGDANLFDALSHYEFCEKGLVECPVTSVGTIHDFLPHKLEKQWVYYCCGPQEVFTNSFLAMPSSRVRVLGYQIYKYDIKGFLHWGLNFYNSARSRYQIDPYLTTSADGEFPSGDGFILYPGKNGAYGSIRGEVTYQAIEDINICLALEKLIGREAVIKMIDDAAGRDLRFDDYPKGNDFLEELHAAMIALIAEKTN